MDLGRTLAASAIAGILAVACGHAQAPAPAPPRPAAVDDAQRQAEANACGNHDGGACGAMDPEPRASAE